MPDHHLFLHGDTLPEALAHVVQETPDTPTLFPQQHRELTARDLAVAAERHARGLIAAGVRPGDTVGVLGAAVHEVLPCVFGTVLAGASVSVLPPPDGPRTAERLARRLAAIATTARMRHLVTGGEENGAAAAIHALLPSLRVLPLPLSPPLDGGGDGPAGPGRRPLPAPRPDDTAVVQFPSGSTTRPRGVVLSHRAVLAGLRAILVSARYTREDTVVQWAPFHHDMGLFGCLAQLLNGGTSHVFDPRFLIRHPGELLRHFARCRGTVLTGPNFSYDLLIRAARPELVRELDLSSWRLAFNGAEPVSAATCDAFHRVLEPAGVGPAVMFPVYGLAEATLAVTFPEPGTRPRVVTVDREELGAGRVVLVPEDHQRAKPLVAVGTPVEGAATEIRDEYGLRLGSGLLGELHISGPMVTSGYLGESEPLLRNGWLPTGDLAFHLDGQYFIAGRRKELAVVHGRNYFPEDAESAARAVPGVHRGHCVAVPGTDPGGGEHISVIAETRLTGPPAGALAEALRESVVTALGMPHVRVHLVPPQWLTRTTSGKWQRLAAARRLRGEKGAA